ncbi:efflux RND transporter periplasmic adaptor subunit [Candidatus Protochlamydia phocaeensis]|uniref:efflux RND transporter periplasmic adaptor subunit n=1 Tax=Candidatus Protochlamydia phocaeensis TaxID=1414722 RepID=UPI0008397B19|nr:efflux RND transporter periplasmic adaptor subunit [Candidatus Protochlamydia phocaeensis]
MSKAFSPVYLLFCGMLVLAGCKKEATPSAPAFERPLPVAVGQVMKQDVPVYIEAIGNVSAFNSVEIRPQVVGRIIDIRIKGGDDVQAGTVLYRIDPVPYQLALEKAKATLVRDEAELEFARHKVERYSTLLKGNYVSKLSIEEYKRDVNALEGQVLIDKADIGAAQNNLNYCTILSPIEGRVSLQKIDLGNVVSPNDPLPLATILQVSPVYINFSISQKEFEDLKPILAEGKRQFQAVLPHCLKEFEGEVFAFNNQIDPQTGTLQIKGIISNRDKVLWPGEFVRVRLYIKTKKDAAVVHASAVQLSQKGAYVYALKPDQTVEQLSVKTGEQLGDMIVIDEGLKPGAMVITEGQMNLRQGAKVIVTNEVPSANKDSGNEFISSLH